MCKSSVSGGKWCVVIDGCFYKFFESDVSLHEYLNKITGVEDHEVTVKAMPF